MGTTATTMTTEQIDASLEIFQYRENFVENVTTDVSESMVELYYGDLNIDLDIGIEFSGEFVDKTNIKYGDENLNLTFMKSDTQNLSLVNGSGSYKEANIDLSIVNLHLPNADFQLDENVRAGAGFHTFELSGKMVVKFNDTKVSLGGQFNTGGYSAVGYAGYADDGTRIKTGIGAKATYGLLGGGAFFNVDF